jgi:hypothetical protein
MNAENKQSDMPEIKVPLDEWTESVIDRALAKHVAKCPWQDRVVAVETKASALDTKVGKLELSMAKLVAFMAGAATIGGGTGAIVGRLIHG